MGRRYCATSYPDTDASVTERFNRAGAVMMGKLQMHEFAIGPTSINPHDGPAHNPWDTDRVTGGSSGGSGSSVASGQVMAALGSDTGGSVRIPSALCGIVGFKPTFGRVSRYGVYPLSWSLDTVGPMTRTVRDTALVMNAIAGYDPRDPWSVDRPGEDYTLGLDQMVWTGCGSACPGSTSSIRSTRRSGRRSSRRPSSSRSWGRRLRRCRFPILERSLSISGVIMLAEAAAVHIGHLRTRAGDIGDDVRLRLETAALTPATDYVVAQQARRLFNREMSGVMEDFDLLIAPAVPIGAPRIDEKTVMIDGVTEVAATALSRLTRPFNICGFPTASVPCGFTSDGMPIGIQMAGRAFEDATVLRAAHAYEQATDWHARRPEV